MIAQHAGKDRWSRAHALVDDHVVEYADDGAAVAVVVGNGERSHAGGRTARGRGRVRSDTVDERSYAGIVRGDTVPRRTGAVAVVRPIPVRGEDPPVPADLAEGHPERVPAASGLPVSALTVGVPLATERPPLTTRSSPSASPPPPPMPSHNAQRRAALGRRRPDKVYHP